MRQYIKKRIISFCKSNYQILDDKNFIKGRTIFNAKCHLNAVQDALDNKTKVLLTICIGNDEIFVHFINQDKNDKYIDNTLGWFGNSVYDYYLIREICPIEYKTIWNVLINTKRTLINANSSWLERKLKIIKEEDV